MSFVLVKASKEGCVIGKWEVTCAVWGYVIVLGPFCFGGWWFNLYTYLGNVGFYLCVSLIYND